MVLWVEITLRSALMTVFSFHFQCFPKEIHALFPMSDTGIYLGISNESAGPSNINYLLAYTGILSSVSLAVKCTKT